MPTKKVPNKSIKNARNLAAPAPAPAPAPAIAYPGAFGLFQPSKVAMMRILGTLALLYLIIIAVNIATGIILGALNLNGSIYSSVNNLLSLAIQVVTAPMWAYIMLRSVYSQKETVPTAFDYAKSNGNMLRFFLANLLVGLAVIGGLILLIIPGIIFAMRFSMTGYILVDNPQLDAVEAMRQSWRMTRGHLGKIWGIVGVSILMMIPIITIIGIIATAILLYLYAAASAILYTYLKQQPTDAVVTPASQPVLAAK